MPEEEEEGFVVRDRRRFMSDAPAVPEAAPPQEAATITPPPLPEAPSAPPYGAPLSAPVQQGDSGGMLGPDGGQMFDPEDMRAAFAEAYEKASPEERAEMEAALAEAQGGSAQDIPDIYSILALFLGEIRNIAWLRMGLVANPSTGQIERDLPQAKVAIDTVAFLAAQLAPVVAPEERQPLQAMVSDLQINFVEQSKRAG